ncbi:unnamed protein product [Hydatigera taeniaeformis]|uniref:Tub domain-containing protein n=1 Tax=Hydatigena taeniaeformis TaxID=6205 RepID=A0A0R3X4C9_HYDTA|nr:unnamed protein product [Hydatigera taeniaeformis]
MKNRFSNQGQKRAIAPPPPNRPLPPIPTAEEEAAAAALQHRRLSTTTVATAAMATNATVPNPTSKTSQNRRVVPRMGTRSHPRGSQPSASTVYDVGERVTVSRLSASSPSSSSSSSGCEDATSESHKMSSDDYLKITSQPCLINFESGYQDSDDGYTSLNALDSLKNPHHHRHQRHNQQPLRSPDQTKKASEAQESKRPHSIASSITSSSSFDDESTLVCTSGKDQDLPLDGMYRLKVRSTTSTATIQYHGNKRLVRKYRMKRQEGLEAPPKTVSLDREQKKRLQHQRDRLRRGGGGCSSPCRLVTMLVV